MNKFAPKSEFMKQRAKSLRASGYNAADIARMLFISMDTAYRWTNSGYKEKRIEDQRLARAEKKAAEMDRPSVLPTLPFVPHLGPDRNRKYKMIAPSAVGAA